MKDLAVVFLILALTASCAHLKDTSSQTPAQAGEKAATDPSPGAPAATATPAPTSTPAKPAPRHEIVADTSLHPRGIDFGATIKTVAFGSSANQNLPQPLWKTIAETKPDLFLFLGDNIQKSPEEATAPSMAPYRKLDTLPDYRSFRESVPFMVTWDDKDYGPKEFIKYWAYVGNSTAFDQKGIYHAKIIGPKKKQVQIIMLDTRTFRVKPEKGPAVLLGEEQWQWLEAQLKRPAQVRILATSIPLIAASGQDKWSDFPKERQRFFDLLKKTRTQNLVVVSGDHHQSSIAKTGVKDWGMLFDVTASPINEPLSAAEEDPNYEGKAVAAESFGLAQIDWHERKMSLQIRDATNKVLNSVSFKIR